MLEDVKNVEQSVTFYNVTGYIEKENRIYFAPLNKQLVANVQAGTTKPLCQWYKDYFDSVVGILSSRYQNVSISRWSPSDRTLSVQGTIDLFRKSGVSSDSKAFNYMIVKREVTGVTSQDASINYTYYMGYFITDVQQSGTNTVRLTLDIDNFTNAFYLMNTKQYSDSELLNLDIFNTTLVNCNVERQHYNRVKLVDGEVKIDNNEIFLNPLESYDYKYQKKVSKSPILVNGVTTIYRVSKEQSFPSGADHYDNFLTNREYIVKVQSGGVIGGEVDFTYNSGDVVVFKEYRTDDLDNPTYQIGGGVEVIRKLELNSNGTIKITYTDLDGQHNETFNPSSQSRVYTLTFGTSAKPTISADSTLALNLFKSNVFNAMTNYLGEEESEPSYNFTQEELQELSELPTNATYSDWAVLPELLQKKCIRASVNYLLIKSKESLSAGYGYLNSEAPEHNVDFIGGFTPNRTHGYLSGKVVDPLFTYAVPILNVPRFLKSLEDVLSSIIVKSYVRSYRAIVDSHTAYVTEWHFTYSGYRLASKGNLVTLDNKNITYLGGNVSTQVLCQMLGESDWADVIISASIVKDLPLDMYTIDNTTTSDNTIELSIYSSILELVPTTTMQYGYQVNKRILANLTLPKGLWYNIVPYNRANAQEPASGVTQALMSGTVGVPTATQPVYTQGTEEVTDVTSAEAHANSPFPVGNVIIYQLSGLDSKKIKLNLQETDAYEDVTDSFYEPMLEMNPYVFYSISYTDGVEVPLNKQKYYNLYDVNTNSYATKYIVIYSNNDSQKFGIIPFYKLSDIEELYYMDGLITTISSQLPLNSDSYMSYYSQNLAQMKNQFAVNDYQRGTDLLQKFFWSSPMRALSGGAKGGSKGLASSIISEVGDMGDMAIDWAQSNNVIEMNQKATLAGAGAKPDVVKQAGSDIAFDIEYGVFGLYLNYYRIDNFSYNSIAKGLERFGYLVNRYDTLHVADRVGWNYVKLISADFNHYGEHLNLTTEQESDIMDIFKEGVTLLHSPEYLYNQSLHNHETLIDIDD